MDSLRPDRDELDQYKTRQNKKTNNAVADAQYQGERKTANAPKAAVQAARTSAPVTSFFMVMLVIGLSALSWFSWEQHNDVSELRQNLSDATGFISQSKLLIARLEGELSETGASMEESGSAAEKKLAFLDTEMRKLWGVSNDRNRKSILKNTGDLKSVNKSLLAISKKQAEIATEGKSQYALLTSVLQQQEEDVTKGLSVIDGRVSGLANEFAITRAEQEENAAEITAQVQESVALNKKSMLGLSDVTENMKENSQSISSINESRRQLVERVVDLERKINLLSQGLKSQVN